MFEDLKFMVAVQNQLMKNWGFNFFLRFADRASQYIYLSI